MTGIINKRGYKIKKANQISHRSTIYPCFLPNLGEFIGAGRTDLPGAKVYYFKRLVKGLGGFMKNN